MRANKQVIIDLIVRHIEKGDPTEKICSVICSRFHFTERTFYNHLKIAVKQHTARQEAIKSKVAIVELETAIEARKKAIMTADERKEHLTKIALGELKIKKPFVIAGKIMEYPSEPDHMERMKAITELNKMEGDYAPVKQDTKVTIEPTDPELLKAIADRMNG